ncbi:glycoside hydrolase superfamily [Podospora aff. communis PSN243]|uniref:cellulase n=1 Tax=Podospora aff. communis PSN243 TaxID=3040156 RepID=A0AAV9GD98_9PEZI|nr:glycoside hydrolase superfamily [Podospora aff. communis PSN243]
MRSSSVFFGLAAAGSVVAAPGPFFDSPTPTIKRASKFQFVGVNQAGAEFGNKDLPGTLGKHYTWPVHSAIDTLNTKGFNTHRIAFMMERLVPNKLDGPLDAAYSRSLQETVQYVTSKGGYAVLDPHNFGRYYEKVITDVDGFKKWWATTAKLFATDVHNGFDTNNEYHDMPQDLVVRLNQAAIDGIRGAGATSQYIFIEGNSWTGAWTWVSSGNGASLKDLKDPSDKLVYEMHQYLDKDGSGTSPDCVSSTIGVERVREATNWLKANNKKGILGETAGGANAQCIAALTGMLKYLQDNSDVWTGWLWWAGGPWWADYMFSIEPPSGTAYTRVLPSLQPFI